MVERSHAWLAAFGKLRTRFERRIDLAAMTCVRRAENHRIHHITRQEILLGLGSLRALTSLGINAEVVHLNEGHAALSGFERARLRADGLKVTIFKQVRDASGGWVDAPTSDQTEIDIENAILTRAREQELERAVRTEGQIGRAHV